MSFYAMPALYFQRSPREVAMWQGFRSQAFEMWTLYIIGLIMIAARIYCRTKLIGWKHMKIDDYLIFAVVAIWTAAPVTSLLFLYVANGWHTSILDFTTRKTIPQEEYFTYEYGSKMFMLGLVNYFLIIWVLKFNMLCFYQRVVKGLWVERFVKPVRGFVVISGVVVILTLALTCRPLYQLWQVWPDPGELCVPQNIVFFTVILTFNLLTDICIMLIPAPIILGFNTNKLRKIGLLFLFSLGLFCMVSAILRFTLLFHFNQRGMPVMWSLREDCVGIVVGQAPLVTPMFKRQFWVTIGYVSPKASGQSPSDGPSNGHELGSGPQISSGSSRKTNQLSRRKTADPYSLTQLGITKSGSESEEEIVRQDSPTIPPQVYSPDRAVGIMVEHTIEIESTTEQLCNTNNMPTRRFSDNF